MAEYEDLIIRVKTEEAASKEQLENFKKAFESISGGQRKDDFEKIQRHTNNIERQLKELTQGITSGDPFRAVVNFAATFGLIGVAAKVAYDSIASVINLATSTSKSLIDLAFEAGRVGVHPAQLQREIEQGRIANITRESMIGIATNLTSRLSELKSDPRTRFELMKGLGGDVHQMSLMNNLIDRILVAPQPERLNLVLEGYRRIREKFKDAPETAAVRSEEWIRWWTGGIDLARMKQDFQIVSEQDKAAMDKMIQASEAWNEMSSTMASNMERIVAAVSTKLMNDPAFGAIVRAVNAMLERAREQAEHPEEHPETPSVFEPKAGWSWRDFLNPFFNPLSHPGVYKPQGLMSTGFEDISKELEKQKDYTGELTDQFRRLNALLAGEELTSQDLAAKLGAGLPDVKGNPPFHNQPQGGAVGESNPMQLPSAAPQPGGGSAAEARSTVSQLSVEPPQTPAGTEKKVQRGTVLPGLPPEGRQRAKGATFYGNYPESLGSQLPGGWKDPDDVYKSGPLKGQPMPAFGGYSLATPAVALPFAGAAGRAGKQEGQMVRIWDPSGERSILVPAGDLGPSQNLKGEKVGQRPLDLNAPLLEWMGYAQTKEQAEATGRKKFPGSVDVDYQLVRAEDVEATRALIKAENKLAGTPEAVGRGGIGSDAAREARAAMDATPTALMSTQRAPLATNPNNQAEPTSGYPYLTDQLRINPERSGLSSRTRQPLDYAGADHLLARNFDRSLLDTGLANESRVDASGNLDVNVKAPAGTEVKAEGDGMFKGNVSLDRQMELPTLQ